MANIDLKVGGMTCQGCVRSVEKKLSTVAGVTRVAVDLEKGLAKVEYGGNSPPDLVGAVQQIGFQASL